MPLDQEPSNSHSLKEKVGQSYKLIEHRGIQAMYEIRLAPIQVRLEMLVTWEILSLLTLHPHQHTFPSPLPLEPLALSGSGQILNLLMPVSSFDK